jgi:hypothetical protein
MVNHQQKQQQLNNVAFVLGNGTSRLSVDVNKLIERGKVFGCNALYREYQPHYLIAVDVKMVNEIIASGYHKTNEVWTNPNKGILDKDYIKLFNPHKGWSSGPTALWFAANQGHKNIFILGFDYQGTKGYFNNVYADTYNYKKSSDSATYHGNWLSQTDRTIREYRNTTFYRIIEDGAFIPDKLNLPHHTNLKHINFKEFEDFFPGTIYSDQNLQKSTI